MMDNQLMEYRKELIEDKNSSQDELDKALLTLSSSAFGVSFAFINDLVPESPAYTILLFSSWILWGTTIGMSLIAYFLNVKSLERSISQLSINPDKYYKNPFNAYDKAVKVINLLSLIGFLSGLLLIGIFIKLNF